MQRKVVKLGIVGLGRWSKVLTAAAKTSDSLEIVAGFSRSQDKRDEFTAEFGIKTCESLESLLNLDEIEGVIITVPKFKISLVHFTSFYNNLFWVINKKYIWKNL